MQEKVMFQHRSCLLSNCGVDNNSVHVMSQPVKRVGDNMYKMLHFFSAGIDITIEVDIKQQTQDYSRITTIQIKYVYV